MTPFILKGRQRLPPEPTANPEQFYDRQSQLWRNRMSRVPVVIEMQRRFESSRFGETTLTATLEGADQSEISSHTTSQFGETTETRMPAEGSDQPLSLDTLSSQFGETTMTKAVGEGADADVLSSQFGETTRTFAGGEGADDPASDLLSSQFGETTVKKIGEGSDQCESALFDELTPRIEPRL